MHFRKTALPGPVSSVPLQLIFLVLCLNSSLLNSLFVLIVPQKEPNKKLLIKKLARGKHSCSNVGISFSMVFSTKSPISRHLFNFRR